MQTNEESQQGTHGSTQASPHSEARTYGRFAAMILTSTTVMFVLTYTNVYVADHIRWSEERFYMALLMGAAMAIVMLGFMWGMMYRSVRINLAIVALALVLGVLALWLSRSQTFVDDEDYMRGMIPHHSIAILTSERAGIEDVRVRDLADAISQTQREEIFEMDWLIQDIEQNGLATTQEQADQRPVPEFSESP
jgi:FlaA1/EpsC-like NDP-sugar epimerase